MLRKKSLKKRLVLLCLFTGLILSSAVSVSAVEYNQNGTIVGEGLPTVSCYVNSWSGMEEYKAIMLDNRTYLPLDAFRKLDLANVDNIQAAYINLLGEEFIVVGMSLSNENATISLSFTREEDRWYYTATKVTVQGSGDAMDVMTSEETLVDPTLVEIINAEGYNYVPVGVFRNIGIEILWDNQEKAATITGEFLTV